MEARNFMQRNQCIENEPWICCPRPVPRLTTTAATRTPRIKVSEELLPRSPACGLDTADKIVGGEVTRIDEFPWLVRLITTLRAERELILTYKE